MNILLTLGQNLLKWIGIFPLTSWGFMWVDCMSTWQNKKANPGRSCFLIVYCTSCCTFLVLSAMFFLYLVLPNFIQPGSLREVLVLTFLAHFSQGEQLHSGSCYVQKERRTQYLVLSTLSNIFILVMKQIAKH